MDISAIRLKLTDFVKKYKYAVIILLIGVLLMLIPLQQSGKTEQPENIRETDNVLNTDQLLEDILRQVAGAGEVQVLLTVMSGEEKIFQTDVKQAQTEDNSNSQVDTATVTDYDRNENGLIRQTISPIYRGAIVVCEGADSAQVRLAIVDAVSKVTGLSADRISVLKMK